MWRCVSILTTQGTGVCWSFAGHFIMLKTRFSLVFPWNTCEYVGVCVMYMGIYAGPVLSHPHATSCCTIHLARCTHRLHRCAVTVRCFGPASPVFQAVNTMQQQHALQWPWRAML